MPQKKINKGVIEARKIINKLNITIPNEYSLEDIINADNGPIIVYKNIQGSEGKIVNGELFSIITVNNNTNNIRKKRFTLAHEFGHYKMHRDIKAINCNDEKFWDWGGKEHIETEANYFASELLMPENVFLQYTKKEPFNIEYLQNTADKFETSFLATAIRYAEVGNDPIMLFCSREGFIQWYKKNDLFPYVGVTVDDRVPSGSLINDYYKGIVNQDETIDIDPKYWKIDSKEYEDFTFNETLIRFPQFNYNLTIISITK